MNTGEMTIQEQLMKKSRELVGLQSEQARLEEQLSEVKTRQDQIQIHEMPDLMEEAGISDFKDLDGRQFKIKEQVFVNLTVDNRAEFYKWCESNELAGIIKTVVEVPFAMGEFEKANALALSITETGREAACNRSIHASTLKSTATKKLNAGDNWPEELAPTTVVKSVETKEPKKA